MSALWHFLLSSWAGSFSLLLLLVVLVLAVFSEQLAPYDPIVADFGAMEASPSGEHLLGTDQLGRDVLSRIIFGARLTLIIAVASVVIGDSVGFLWGLVTGYLGHRFDMLSQRVLDLLMAFPSLILAMLLLTGLGSGIHTVIVAIAVTRIPLTTRVIRSVVLTIKEMAYVESAHAIGLKPWRVISAHVAPQCVAPLLVISSFNLGSAIFTEAALSFLGLGTPPPTPTWGADLGAVLAGSFRPSWWLVLFPGLAITLTIVATNLIGDALRDFLDPRLKGKLQ